jgi:hypothetical protein
MVLHAEKTLRFTEFRDLIKKELLDRPAGLTWVELRKRLALPYDHPCQTWVAQLERDIGLTRKDRVNGAYVWKVEPRNGNTELNQDGSKIIAKE